MTRPSRGGVQGLPLTPYSLTVRYGASGQGTGWFGPSAPLRPSAPLEVAGRRFDYPAGYNLDTTARASEAVGFAQLRRLADGYDLLRLVIETRKDQAARMRWTIRARDGERGNDARAKALTAFFRKPDGLNAWADWLRMGLEDVLVIDAFTLFKQRDRAGNLLALEPIDGATIKPILGENGRIPHPLLRGGDTLWPEAYQQILKGLPAVNYTARDLLYRPRNLRTDRVYGYSPVEQVMTTVNIALRRQVMTLEYFTSGTVPDALIGVPETWTPDQIATYQRYWDSLFTDATAERRRARFVPGKVALHQTSEPQLKGEFDEWLSRIVCFAFSTSPQALIKQMNRASADTQKEIAEQEGLAPLLDWVKTTVDGVLEDEFDAADHEFAWIEEQHLDAAKQAEIARGQTSGGLRTINEARADLGLAPDPNPAANALMVLTGSGFLPIEANTLAGRQASLAAFGPTDASARAPGVGETNRDAKIRTEDVTKEDVAKEDVTKLVARLLAKFDAAQPRGADGRWTDAGGASSKLDAAAEEERRAFNHAVLKTIAGGAVIAGGAIVTALSGGTAPVAVTAAVFIAENYLLADALTEAGRHIGRYLGYGDAEIADILDHLAREIGMGKAARGSSAGGAEGDAADLLRARLGAAVDAALDVMIAKAEAAPEDRVDAVRKALDALRARFRAAIAALAVPAAKTRHTAFTKRWRRPAPLPFDRPATRRGTTAMAGRLAAALTRTGQAVADRIRGLDRVVKAATEPDPDDRSARDTRATDATLDGYGFPELRAVAPEIAEDLAHVATDTVRRSVVQLGAEDRDGLVNQVNARAVAAARARAAEMVGLRWDSAGNLVPARRPDMTITEATRAMLRETIAGGLARNIGLDAIADEIAASYAVSEARADLIAQTEIARVNGLASLETYAEAAALGLAVEKAWWAEPGCCAACRANAEAGPIALDADFPSGDAATPAHPGCRCVVAPVVAAGTEDDPVGKAFDPSKHPRDSTGRFSGAGGSGRSARRLARRALQDPQHRDDLDLGRADGARYGVHAGRDVDGWRHSVHADAVRHIDGRHGPDSADRHPISAADYENLPRVLSRGTVTAGGTTRRQNLQTVIVQHTIGGTTYRAVLTVHPRRQALRLHTFTKS